MANCVKCRFSLNLQLFSVVLKSAPVKYIATSCPWNSYQIHSSCPSMNSWWQNNPSLWLLWTVSIPKWVSILWDAAYAPSDAKLVEGGVCLNKWLSKQSWGWWFETLSRPLWRHRNVLFKLSSPKNTEGGIFSQGIVEHLAISNHMNWIRQYHP